jgi:amino acid adenylation domain-containing protein
MFTHQLFETQARETPDNVALVYGDQSLSYCELDRRANQLARRLRSFGVVPEVPVGVCMERSLELVIAMVGLLKAGGVYVPLDPLNPKERLSFILEETQPKVLLAQKRLLEGLRATGAPADICLDQDWSTVSSESADPVENLTTSGNLGFLIYTSGSTGDPKAVMLPHHPRDSRVSYEQKIYQLGSDDRHVLKSSISFTLLLRELFWPLLTGARLIISPPGTEGNLDYLLDLIAKHKISIITLTPSTLRTILYQNALERCRSLRHIVCFGEALTAELESLYFSKLSAALSVYYGATEAPSATYRKCLPSETRDATELGQPLPGVELHMLDESLQPGTSGEIYLGGKLAHGYFKRPDLTAERFVPHPFSDKPGARLYKTGDFGRFLPYGRTEFVGRVDDLVKIRGFRVALGEVEAVLRQHPDIQQAVVADRAIGGDNRLIGYFVTEHNRNLKIGELREFLRKKLPEYMIPAEFIFLQQLPLTPNGKVDRRALPTPDSRSAGDGHDLVAPRDLVELELARIWENVFNVTPIGMKDNFFDLGGHSLLAARLFAQIEQKFGKRLPLATLFQAPTVEQLSKLLRRDDWTPSWSSLVPIQSNGSRPPFFCVHAHGGNVLNFNDLARHLGNDQPFFGLQAKGLDGIHPKHTSVEEMATNYLKEIREIQPAGPYLLGGYCFGGSVAFEMAQQLHAQGEKVALLAMIDSIAPGYSTKLPWGQRRMAQIVFHWRTVEKLGTKEKLDYVMAKGKIALARVGDRMKAIAARACLSLGLTLPRALQGVLRLRRSLKPYSAKVYPGKIDVFAPTESHSGYFRFESHMGWTGLAGGGLDIHPIPGKVTSIITKPLVKVLAEELSSCIEREIATRCDNPDTCAYL